jgi:eukaryotic-like serine/threonine-protein kinase
MPLATGTHLGPYEILALLGAGGMGEVYRARDTSLKREVAIKVLPAAWSRDRERLRRFELEAQAAAALNGHRKKLWRKIRLPEPGPQMAIAWQ